MTNLKTLKANAFQNEDVKSAYDALDAGFVVARAIIELRNNADLTQEALAELMISNQR